MAKYRPTWESLAQYRVPDWYVDAKFGIFIHWGVYSVPAFGNEWYPRNMYLQDRPEFQHHIETYGPQSEFGYKDFIPMFRAEQYDPAAWAALFRDAGARFVVPVAEHHDGFAMYDSDFSRWSAVQMGPKRDLVGELADAVRAAGMVFGLSTHREEHWWFMNGGREFDSDVQDPEYALPSASAQPSPPGYLPKVGAARTGPCVRTLSSRRLAGKDARADRQISATAYLVRLVDRADRLQALSAEARRLLLQPGEVGARALPSITNTMRSSRTLLSTTSSVGKAQRHQSALLARPTPPFPRTLGLYHQPRLQDSGRVSSATWWTSSARTAHCWPISAPGLDGTIPEPEVAVMLRDIGRWLKVNGEAPMARVRGPASEKVQLRPLRGISLTPNDALHQRRRAVHYQAACALRGSGSGWPDDWRISPWERVQARSRRRAPRQQRDACLVTGCRWTDRECSRSQAV